MSEISRLKVLVADDEQVIANTLAIILNQAGFEARAVYSGEGAVETALSFLPQLLISDVVMAGISGIEAAIQVIAKLPSCRILLFSGQAATADLLSKARSQNHHFEILSKPVHPSDLLAKVRGLDMAVLLELSRIRFPCSRRSYVVTHPQAATSRTIRFTRNFTMSLETDVRYLLDRIEIQDKVALYGLGQDFHQAGAENKNILEEWSELFTPDARIDITDLGMGEYGLMEYAEVMRGKGLKGGGLEVSFKAWQHIEGHATVKIDGDTATSVALHSHSHEARDGVRNLIDAGYWYDAWVRTPGGWRIKTRRHKPCYTNTYPVVAGPPFLDV